MNIADLQQWKANNTNSIGLLDTSDLGTTERELIKLLLNSSEVRYSDDEQTRKDVIDFLAFMEQSRCTLRVEMSISMTHCPNLTLGVMVWLVISRFKLFFAKKFSELSAVINSSWWIRGTTEDMSFIKAGLVAYQKPVSDFTVAELTCSAHCLLEPLRASDSVQKILSSYEYEDSESHTYIACLELRLAELSLGYDSKGNSIPPEAYDCDIYCHEGTIKERAYALGVALNNLLHDAKVLHWQYDTNILEGIDEEIEKLADNAGIWVTTEAAKWKNDETDMKQEEFLHRRLCLSCGEIEAIARVGVINPIDKVHTLRCSRQHCANALLSLTGQELEESFPCAKHWSDLFWTDLCFSNKVGDGTLRLYGTFLFPYECMLSGWIPRHPYPYLCEAPTVPEMILVQPQDAGKPKIYIISCLKMALLVWVKYILARHDGIIFVEGTLYDVGSLHTLWSH